MKRKKEEDPQRKEDSKRKEGSYSEDKSETAKYEDSFYEFMAKVVVESAKNPNYDFYNVGSNLVFFMRSHAEPSNFTRDYETECTELRKTYQTLKSRIEEIRKTTLPDTLTLPSNNFIRSIDIFLESILDATHTQKVLSDDPTRAKYVSEVSLCHDCFEKTHEMLNDKEVFILGDMSDVH